MSANEKRQDQLDRAYNSGFESGERGISRPLIVYDDDAGTTAQKYKGFRDGAESRKTK